MLIIDVFAGYAICGAGSLIGACVMMMATPANPHMARGLEMCIAAFIVIGAGLFQFVAFRGAPPPWSILLAAESAAIGTALFGWGFVQLGGRRINPVFIRCLLLVVAASMVLAQAMSDRALAITMELCCFLVGVGVLTFGFENVRRPGYLAQKAVFTSLALYTISWLVALAAALSASGEPPAHLLYVTEPMLSMYAIFYGIVPILMASLVLNHLNEELTRMLSIKAVTDELTGVSTRRGLYENAPAIRELAERECAITAVILLDIDHFKKINDSHGHAAGDNVLQQAARIMEFALRKGSLLARYGGEEFVAVLSVPDLPTARRAAERLRHAVESQPLQLGTKRLSVSVTVSAGLAIWGRDEDLAIALARADAALYRAKACGRNRVECDLAAA
ncbi:MAG TPA: GGDEF domain-containing protein [Rubrivivax sp.]|nr:GGDEF domain-containing protein [Rubrivivax sp.]